MTATTSQLEINPTDNSQAGFYTIQFYQSYTGSDVYSEDTTLVVNVLCSETAWEDQSVTKMTVYID